LTSTWPRAVELGVDLAGVCSFLFLVIFFNIALGGVVIVVIEVDSFYEPPPGVQVQGFVDFEEPVETVATVLHHINVVIDIPIKEKLEAISPAVAVRLALENYLLWGRFRPK
jgi:hypothetical protein